MTQVFDHLQISGYRGFKEVNLSELGQINIFVGNNNSGKTSLLEAISILCNPLDPFQWLEVSQRRLYLGRLPGFRPDLEAVRWVFRQERGFRETIDSGVYQSDISITSDGNISIQKLEAKLEEIYGASLGKSSQERLNDDTDSFETEAASSGVELSVIVHLISEQGNLFSRDAEPRKEIFQFWERERFVQRRRNKPIVKNATIFPAYSSSEPILSRISQIILEEEYGKGAVLELIRSFDDNIIDFHILFPAPRTTLFIEHKDLGLAPLYVFGDGFKRTLIIALTVLTINSGVLLIDEIETSIHVSALGRVFAWLIETCRRRKIQLFVTTHSLEAIDAMLQPQTHTDDVVAFRLNPKGQAPQRFSGDLLHRLRSDRGLDVR